MGPGMLAVFAVVRDSLLGVLTSSLKGELTSDGLYQIRNAFIHDQQKGQMMAVATRLDRALNDDSSPTTWGPNWR